MTVADAPACSPMRLSLRGVAVLLIWRKANTRRVVAKAVN
jgi:hypothetical protein